MGKDEQNRIQHLFHRYAADEVTTEEAQELFIWLNHSENDAAMKQHLIQLLETTPTSDRDYYDEAKWNEVVNKILKANKPTKHKSLIYLSKPWRRQAIKIAAAASIVLLATIGIWFYTQTQESSTQHPVSIAIGTSNQIDIAPGTNRATLTLSGGKIITLSEKKQGIKVTQDKITYNDGQHVGLPLNKGGQGGVSQTTSELVIITTPRGGQYQVILPDGTQVYLNALSSIQFPITFSGDNRPVEVIGEAYFDIAQNATKPFIVTTPTLTTTVLGTIFNVKAYEDEPTTITVATGKIKVETTTPQHHNTTTLQQNEQASLNTTTGQIEVKEVNAADQITWTTGFFLFHSADIQTIMRQAARWYDIEVAYDLPDEASVRSGGIPIDKFTGKIPRNVNLSQMLKMLELSDVNYEIENRKITIKQ